MGNKAALMCNKTTEELVAACIIAVILNHILYYSRIDLMLRK